MAQLLYLCCSFAHGIENACHFTNIKVSQIKFSYLQQQVYSTAYTKPTHPIHRMQTTTYATTLLKNDKVSTGPVCHIRTTLLRTAETARAKEGNAVSTILPLPCGFIHPAGNLTLWVFRNQEVVSTPGLVHVQSHVNYLTRFPSCICLDPALTKISLYFCVFPLVRLTQPRCLYRIWHNETLVLTECFVCSVTPAKR